MNNLWFELNSWVDTWWYEIVNVISKYIQVNSVTYSTNTLVTKIITTNTISITKVDIVNNVIINKLYTINTYD